MKVIAMTSRTVKTYWLKLEGDEVRPMPYSRVGRHYKVERVEVVKRDGNVLSVRLIGSALKKDGSVGAVRADELLHGEREWPAWLHGIVKGLA